MTMKRKGAAPAATGPRRVQPLMENGDQNMEMNNTFARSSQFDMAASLSEPLEVAHGSARALMMMATTFEGHDQLAVYTVLCVLLDAIKKAEEVQGELFRALHPDQGRVVA